VQLLLIIALQVQACHRVVWIEVTLPTYP